MMGYHRYERSVIETCRTLHEAATGSGDPVSDDHFLVLYNWLRRRVDDWVQPSSFYDGAVRTLAYATLDELEAEATRIERTKGGAR